MARFRTFRNDDAPALVRLWNEAFTGRGAVSLSTGPPPRGETVLEYFLFAKPYFDPAGLIVAVEEDAVIGFALSGFAPNAEETGLDRSTGVVCLIGVLPAHRGKGIGSGLLSRSEEYLRSQGADTILAGPLAPRNPFSFGLYGGAQSPGFLESTPNVGVFLRRRGYEVVETSLVFQRRLDRPINVTDGRFAALRRRYELRSVPRRGAASWYRESVYGPLEPEEYRLEERGAGRPVGRAFLWEMEPFGPRWKEHPVGILDVRVQRDHRQQGIAKYLLTQLLRHFQDEYFTLAEAHARQEDKAAVALLRSLGFEQVDAGHLYRRGS